MAYVRKSSEEPRRRAPAKDPDIREMQLISAAIDLAEKQIKDGTASATVLTHYLKLGSGRERLERERLEAENHLLREKLEEAKSRKRSETFYEDVLKAMRAYSGQEDPEVDDYEG